MSRAVMLRAVHLHTFFLGIRFQNGTGNGVKQLQMYSELLPNVDSISFSLYGHLYKVIMLRDNAYVLHWFL